MDLFLYWKDHPPMQLLIEGIAYGLSGASSRRSSAGKVVEPPNPKVGSAEELASILQSAGLPFEVIRRGR